MLLHGASTVVHVPDASDFVAHVKVTLENDVIKLQQNVAVDTQLTEPLRLVAETALKQETTTHSSFRKSCSVAM